MADEPNLALKSPKTRLLQVLSWVLAGLVCIALLSFLFWQRGVAATMPVIRESVAIPTIVANEVNTPEFVESTASGLGRLPNPTTERGSELRMLPFSYTVKSGDSVWGISERYGIAVESILYANYDILQDKSDNLMPGQVLTIPPTDGILHTWRKKDTIDSVASKYGAKPDDILFFIGNNFDLANPEVKSGTQVMVPGGARELVEISVVAVVKDGATGQYISGFRGPGSCALPSLSIHGNGFFIWPSAVHTISGNNWSPGHRAIDIGASLGAQIFAADTGTVVYAGWLDGGYGNFVVIDHGNGFQTLYEHLDSITVHCGSIVSQGNVIGYGGTTGNSTGPHLHFEIRYNGTPVNPWDYLP